MIDLPRIHIVAPAGVTTKAKTRKGIKTISGFGFNCIEGKSLFNKNGYLAGTDKERLADFQFAINDNPIAVWAARGGYGCSRIIDQINWKKFIKKPCWIVGFSDITIIHIFLSNNGIPSIHGPIINQAGDGVYKDEIIILSNLLKRYIFPEYILKTSIQNRIGEAISSITGGNLTLITSSLGTSSEIITDNKILFIEEVGEAAYRIDRMLIQLKRAGKLQKLRGLIIGHMTNITDEKEFGKTVSEIFLEHVSDYTFPVCFHFPAGHEAPNMPIILGMKAKLIVSKKSVSLKYL
jgi:muramoyltetrapeptide carboxypeptidase